MIQLQWALSIKQAIFPDEGAMIRQVVLKIGLYYNDKMFFDIFLGGFISQVISCMGGLIIIKQGSMYTYVYLFYHYDSNFTTVCIHEMICFEKECLLPAVHQIVFVSCQRTVNRRKSFMFSKHPSPPG